MPFLFREIRYEQTATYFLVFKRKNLRIPKYTEVANFDVLVFGDLAVRRGNVVQNTRCCGSGAIAVSMAHFLPKAKITACDISPEALEVARGNAARNGLNGRIEFRESDLFFMTKRKKTVRIKDSFDMILSNPPYIPTQDIDTLQTEVRDHEPIKALDGGSDGLDFYRRIAEDAFGSLKKDGLMFLEIGCDQAEAVTSLLRGAGYYSVIDVH